MPRFAFRAADRLGNTVDGSLESPDHAAAIQQIQQMGYAPIGVQLVEAQPDLQRTAALSGVGSATATVGGKPRPVDLTQPVTEMPSAAVDLFAPRPDETTEAPSGAGAFRPFGTGVADLTQEITPGLPAEAASGASEMTARMERLEPWERSVAANAAEATIAMNPASSPTVQMPPMPGLARPKNEIVRGLERIPFGANSLRQVSLGQRFKEVMLYPIFSGVVLKDLAPWYRQFATLISAGLPLHQAMVALEANTNNGRLKEVSRNGVRQVQAGGRFSDVMAAYPWIFPPMHLEMVRAAEQGGMLEQVLRQVGDYVEHELEVRRLISRETLYPKIVLLALLFLMGKPGIFNGTPAIAGLIVGKLLDGRIYTPTDYLWDTVGFGAMILIPILLLVVVFRLFLFNVPGTRNAYDTFKINLPIVGNIIRTFAIAKFSRTYAALSRSGFAAGSSLEIAGDASGNVVIARAAQHAMRQAERGALPSEALRQSGQFSEIAVNMLRTGETSGSLDDMMDKVADYHEAEGKSKSHMYALIFSVLVLIVVAIIVLMVLLKFYGGYGASVSAAGAE